MKEILQNNFYRNKSIIVFIITLILIMYLIHDNELYVILGHYAITDHFIDWEFVRGFIKCSIEGKNRYLDNTCDILNRKAVYPPLWQYIPNIIYYLKPIFIFWISFICLVTIITISASPDNVYKFTILTLTIFSPYFLYAYQRLNVEIIFLIFTFIFIFLYESNNQIKKIIGEMLIFLMFFLKIYTAPLFLFVLNENKSKVILYFFLGLFLIFFFLFNFQEEFRIISINKDMAGLPGSGTFSGSSFYFFLINIFGYNASTHSYVYIFLNLFLIILIFFIIKTKKEGDNDNDLNLNEKLWTAGFLILIFCFIFSYNVNYRLIFVALLIPLFFDKNFYKNKDNLNLSLFFLIIFFLRCHLPTLILHLVAKKKEFVNIVFENYMFDIFDSILQWILIVVLIKICKKNNFIKRLFRNQFLRKLRI